MPIGLLVPIAAIPGALFGAVTLSILIYYLLALFGFVAVPPGEFDLYCLIISVPEGICMGGAASIATALILFKEGRGAGWVCREGGRLVVLANVILVFLFLSSLFIEGDLPSSEDLFLLLLVFGPPSLLAIQMIRYGDRLMRNGK